jgi:tape measure domain-containing protein
MGKTISSLNVILGGITSPFSAAFGGAQKHITSFQSSITSAGATLLKFTGIGAAVGAVLGTIGSAKSAISLAADLEQTGIAFETMLGSGEAAQALMQELTQFASSTPFEFPGIADAAKKLLAFGVANTDIQGKLKTLGDISAGTGKDLNELAGIYGKIKSRGQLTGETLNQLAEAGVPIYRALSEQLGVAQSEVAGMVSKGAVGFAQVDQALTSLTATGGQFAGLMEKQSRSLGGLWSTLTDNISMTAAGMAQTLIDAFNIKDVMTGFIGWLGNAGTWLQNAAKAWAPVVLGAMTGIYNGITWALGAVWTFVQPTVNSIVTFIGNNWRSMLETAIGYWSSIYGLASTVFGAVWTVVKTVASGLTSAWTWAMDKLGFKTAETGTTVGNIWANVSNASKWMVEQVTLGINVVTFGLNNLGTVAAWVATSVAYQVVRIGNEFLYVFTDVIPGVLTWFSNNWRDVFTTVWSFYKSVWTNIAVNTGNFAKALWSFLKGDGFNFQWTGLLEGFENTIKEMPKIAERQIGPLEASLADQSKTLGDSLGNGLADYLSSQKRTAKDAAAAIANGIGNAFGNMPAITSPEIKPPPVVPPVIPPPDTTEVNTALDETKAKADDVAQSFAAVVAGSAEAMQLAAQAAFSSSIMSSGISATLAPPSATSQSAAREAGKNAGPDGLGKILREEVIKIITAIKDNGFQITEAT